MKKLLMGSLILSVFSISMLVFQFSCKKDANAQASTTSTSSLDITLLNKPVQTQIGSIDSSGHSVPVYRTTGEFYTIKNDGSNLSKINISLPSGLYTNAGLSASYLSPDGKKLVFLASDANFQTFVYSFTISTGTLNKIIDCGVTNSYQLSGTY